jgi:hypothetical protein
MIYTTAIMLRPSSIVLFLAKVLVATLQGLKTLLEE